MQHSIGNKLRSALRQVPDFPKPGINFYDITTLLLEPLLFRETIEALHVRYAAQKIDAIAAVEARGFIFGSALAFVLGAALVPLRKPGKLPAETEQVRYSLEYGADGLEIHRDALQPGQRVVVVDDLLATGGTAKSAISLCRRLGAEVLECSFVVELSFLEGRQALAPTPVFSLIQYDS